MKFSITTVGLQLSYQSVLFQCFNTFAGVLCSEELVVEQIIPKEFVSPESSKLALYGADPGGLFFVTTNHLQDRYFSANHRRASGSIRTASN